MRWQRQPIALTPTPGRPDADGCFSGNAVSHRGKIIAFYSTHRADRWWQPVAAADSDPSGTVFTKRPELLVSRPPQGVTTFRDPYVWREGEHWNMIVGAGFGDGRAAALLYTSHDLASWTYRGPLHSRSDAADGLPTGDAWECPQLATYADGGLLLVTSAWYRHSGPGHTVGWAGARDGTGHHFDAPRRLDHGPDFYAPALLHAPDGRWLLWGWSREARDDAWTLEAGWAGLLTLPREVSLTPDGRVQQAPARELAALRSGPPSRTVRTVAPGESAVLAELDSVAEVYVELAFDGAPVCGLRLNTSPDNSEYLGFAVRYGEVQVDRSRSAHDPRAHGGAYSLPLPGAVPGGNCRLRILIDRSVAEVFTDAGEALTLRFYPGHDAPWSLTAHGLGGDCVRLGTEAHALRPPEGDER